MIENIRKIKLKRKLKKLKKNKINKLFLYITSNFSNL